jgi:hypothetical protein
MITITTTTTIQIMFCVLIRPTPSAWVVTLFLPPGGSCIPHGIKKGRRGRSPVVHPQFIAWLYKGKLRARGLRGAAFTSLSALHPEARARTRSRSRQRLRIGQNSIKERKGRDPLKDPGRVSRLADVSAPYGAAGVAKHCLSAFVATLGRPKNGGVFSKHWRSLPTVLN